MIQPVNATDPRAVFRGSNKTYGKSYVKPQVTSRIALLNAGGVAAAAGGVTTAVARAYTSSWAHAGVLGLFGSFLTLFFMTPQLIEKLGTMRQVKGGESDLVPKSKTEQIAEVAREHVRPLKKLVQFRQADV